MQSTLSITADWERLDEGSLEERACFAGVTILCNEHCLTEGHDGFVNRTRPGPLISAYHLAEWLAWNWWRLRWEPRSHAPDWPFAHRLTTIGEGYVWPNITMFSDGERTTLIARPTAGRSATAFRYISDHVASVRSPEFESAVDQFVNQVLGQLQAEGVDGTNLDRLWCELSEERRQPETARRRKLEALLGEDPDKADPTTIERLLLDSRQLGERAVEELAAGRRHDMHPMTADELREHVTSSGFSASPRDVVHLAPGALAPAPGAPAWKLGADAARALRAQEGLGDRSLTNDTLASLAGVDERALTDDRPGPNLSFALDRNRTEGVVVLRSRWPTSRRFELARLLADRIIAAPPGKLHAATRAYTYRQKMQRSFAAELLSPFEAVDAMLGGDYSEEAQVDVAEHFHVSELTIRTLLVNHRRLEREDVDEDFEIAA